MVVNYQHDPYPLVGRLFFIIQVGDLREEAKLEGGTLHNRRVFGFLEHINCPLLCGLGL